MTAPGSGPLATTRARLTRGAETSRLVGAVRTVHSTLTRWTRGSRIVGWFLTEPDPRVVRIDLREAALLGPPLRLTTRAGDRLGRRLAGSGLDGAAWGIATRVAAAPLRWLGVAIAAIALVAVLASVASGDVAGSPLLVLGGALLLTRERRSASELAATRLGPALEGAFAPPDEPRDGER